MKRTIVAAIVCLSVVGCASSPSSKTAVSPRADSVHPDLALTPGAADPAVTQANIATTICTSGYTAAVRSVPEAVNAKVYAEYGITSHPTGAYDIDHLIPLEVGGSNDLANLWPEPTTGTNNSHDKDAVENRLHVAVCARQMTLAAAQAQIIHWDAPSTPAPPTIRLPAHPPVTTVLPSTAPATMPPTAPPTTAPAAPAGDQGVKKAGEFCSPYGATAHTTTGKLLGCTTVDANGHDHWAG
jgi:hypothetical protein